jgi:hypothetical protein
MATLKLILKTRWFDMVLSGQKDEDYREIKPYWVERLIKKPAEMEWQEYQEFLWDIQNPESRFAFHHEVLKYFNCGFKKFDTIQISSQGADMVTRKIIRVYMGTDIGMGDSAGGAPTVPVFKIKFGAEISRENC